MSQRLTSHEELRVYRQAFEAAMEIFEISKQFPREEMYSLTDQMRRSSRSVCANITEAWRRRRYEGSFLSKLNDAEAEAAETQTWVHFAIRCKYLAPEHGDALCRAYDEILAMIVTMIRHPERWSLPRRQTP